MIGKFCYSLNGENYVGAFDTRKQAQAEGMKRARELPDPPNTIFVGKFAAANPQANGHAQHVLDAMADRIVKDLGEAGKDLFKRLSKRQVKELDEAIEAAILAWLGKQNLTAALSKVAAISEHPVHPAPAVAAKAADEVHDLGESQYPQDAG